MHIAVGAPVAERAWILPEWISAIKKQQFIEPTQVSIVCLYTESNDDTLEILQWYGVDVVHSSLPTRDLERIDGHLWGTANHEYEYMAQLRNELRREVIVRDADYFFSLDTDIILPRPWALEDFTMRVKSAHLDAAAPLVNMEQNHAIEEPAWNYMRFTPHGGAERFVTPAVAAGRMFSTDVIMAAMLLNRKAQLVPWAEHGLGEDIGWSIQAHRRGVRVGVDPSMHFEHRMTRA